MKKIVSHLPPRHMDDFLAIAILKTLYPNAELEYVHPQEVPQEYYEDYQVALIDAGGKYEPDKRNFDHHQDKNLECSLVLVIKHFLPTFYKRVKNHKALTFIDLTDRFGVKKASEITNTPLSKEIDQMRKTVLLADPEKHYEEIADAFKKALENSSDYNEFMEEFYNTLNSLGVLEINGR